MVEATTLAALGGTDPYEYLAGILGISAEVLLVIISIIAIWSLVWKGFALWKAANKRSVPWFVVLLIFNTIGILEILYIFVFSKMNFGKKTEIKPEIKTKITPKKKR